MSSEQITLDSSKSNRVNLRINGSTGSDEIPHGKQIYWYVCGPTVYDLSHLGHARTYITNDILRRITKYLGYDVFSVMNITNVDDKIINKANAIGSDFKTVSDEYANIFLETLDKLNVERVDDVTFVTDYIVEIIQFVQRIIDNGLGYESEGSVYIDTVKFYESGYQDTLFDTSKIIENQKTKLTEDLQSQKRDHRDFALWKASKDGEPAWDSPWGPGRPAWHIECSAMIDSTLYNESNVYVIHTGGEDLLFPHHENEVKQFIAHSGRNPMNMFMHFGRLNVDSRKMSNSESNHIKIKDIFPEYEPNDLRMLFLMRNYASRVDYSPDGLTYARNVLEKFTNFVKHCDAYINSTPNRTLNADDKTVLQFIFEKSQEVDRALANNYNTEDALDRLIEILERGQHYVTDETSRNNIIINRFKAVILKYLNVFGFDFTSSTDSDSSKYIEAIVTIRDTIREIGRSKEMSKGDLFKLSDEIRDEVAKELGFTIEDKGKAPSIWYAS